MQRILKLYNSLHDVCFLDPAGIIINWAQRQLQRKTKRSHTTIASSKRKTGKGLDQAAIKNQREAREPTTMRDQSANNMTALR
jgi:hypothetical protein